MQDIPGLDPLYCAQTLFRRREYVACAVRSGCHALRCLTATGRVHCAAGEESLRQGQNLVLSRTASSYNGQAAWYLKTRALTEHVRIDETELEEEGLADILLDDTATSSLPSMLT